MGGGAILTEIHSNSWIGASAAGTCLNLDILIIIYLQFFLCRQQYADFPESHPSMTSSWRWKGGVAQTKFSFWCRSKQQQPESFFTFFLLNEMKRKDAFHQDSQRSEKETKFVKLSRELEIDHVCLFYHNKSRGILRIKDNSLKHFFTEFVSVAKTPLHFYVLSKLEEKERTMNSKFKVIPESFIRMVACCLIRHR